MKDLVFQIREAILDAENEKQVTLVCDSLSCPIVARAISDEVDARMSAFVKSAVLLSPLFAPQYDAFTNVLDSIDGTDMPRNLRPASFSFNSQEYDDACTSQSATYCDPLNTDFAPFGTEETSLFYIEEIIQRALSRCWDDRSDAFPDLFCTSQFPIDTIDARRNKIDIQIYVPAEDMVAEPNYVLQIFQDQVYAFTSDRVEYLGGEIGDGLEDHFYIGKNDPVLFDLISNASTRSGSCVEIQIDVPTA